MEVSIVSVNGPSQKSPTIVCNHTPMPKGPSPKVILNNPYIITKKAGIAIILFVSTLSILSEVVSILVPSFWTCLFTDFETTFEINLYLWSAISPSASPFNFAFALLTIGSILFFISEDNFSLSIGSSSNNLILLHLGFTLWFRLSLSLIWDKISAKKSSTSLE